jgi:hypothetical protein
MRTLATLLIGALVLGACQTIPPVTSSAEELPELERICASLVGKQMLSPNWFRLRPYLQHSRDLDAPAVDICVRTCNGSFDLRGGYRLDYVYVNPAHLGRWNANEGIVVSVSLVRGKRRIFHCEFQTVAAVARRPNQAMQPTASPRTAALCDD